MCQVKLNEKMFNINNLCCMWGEEVLHFLNLQRELHKQLDRKYERSWNCNFLHHSFKLNHHQSHNWTHSSRLRSRIAGLKRRPIKINSAYPKKKTCFQRLLKAEYDASRLKNDTVSYFGATTISTTGIYSEEKIKTSLWPPAVFNKRHPAAFASN